MYEVVLKVRTKCAGLKRGYAIPQPQVCELSGRTVQISTWHSGTRVLAEIWVKRDASMDLDYEHARVLEEELKAFERCCTV